MRIAICEDCRDDALKLAEIVGYSSPEHEISFFSSGEEFLASSPYGKYQIVFMDVYFGGLGKNGAEAAMALRGGDPRVIIVFTTTSRAHALDAFHAKASAYLTKPFTREEALAALKDAVSASELTRRDSLALTIHRKQVKVPLADIMYVESQGKYCHIHSVEDTFSALSTLDGIERELPSPRFLPCHQSYIVNLEYVGSILTDFVLKNGERVLVRRRFSRECADIYKRWLLGRLEAERP
jgi:DNA-binding LytR/AlgR family response regulator